MSSPQRHILIIGASSALGSACAGLLRNQQCLVAGAGRTPPAPGLYDAFYPLNFNANPWKTLLASPPCLPHAVLYVSGTGLFGQTASIPEHEARTALETNFWSLARAALACAEAWTKGGQHGHFCAVLSIAALAATPWESYYGAGKACAARFLNGLDLEHAAHGRRFDAVYPGLFDSPFLARSPSYGIATHPHPSKAAPVQKVAVEVVRFLTGERRNPIIGWRENAICLADRLCPGLYSRLVRSRMRRQIGPANPDT